MFSSAKQLYKTLEPYLNKGYILCPDTNFLMNASSLFKKLKNENVHISRQVYDELDRLKSSSSDASREQKRRAFEAREGFRALDIVDSKIIEVAPSSTFSQYNLSQNKPDDKIIASYLHLRDSKNEKILFLTLDRGAKLIAKTAGFETVGFDIEVFNKKRKKEQKILNRFAQKKKINPIQRLFLGLAGIYGLMTIFIQSMIGLGLIILFFKVMFFPDKGYLATAEPVSVLDGQVIITPTLIYQKDTDESKSFEIYYTVENKQDQIIKGFYNPDRPLEIPDEELEGEEGLSKMNKKLEYDLSLSADQIYVIFDDYREITGTNNKELRKDERYKGFIEIEGDITELKEIQSSVFIPSTEERIPYTIKIEDIEKITSTKLSNMADEV
ncbi:hypothetical protein GCM10008967_39610 [Bacillus carboniphilus]|uniref:PIN domain-containing protein n=1 Tax=Bacillus carboniphilus TaxID=86663 RepID=A0ABP3GHW4_9BACI